MNMETQEKTTVPAKAKAACFISGAEALILSLLEEKVETVFGYPGGAIMPVYDALYDYTGRLNHILVRHEQGAVHAAQGYARASGKTGVCFATSGPGATNLVTGLADAQIDSTPLVCITGQVASTLLGTDAFQETDVMAISMPISKWNVQVSKAEDIPAAIAKAFYIARSGRPGPVLVDITKDAQFGKFHFEYKPCTGLRSYHPQPRLLEEPLKEAAALINNAQKPFLLVGHGVLISAAEQVLKAFAEKTGIPVASTLLGLSAFPTDHPLYTGLLGMHGNYGPNLKTNECDVLIAVGMRFDDRVTGNAAKYARQAKVIHIEIDPAEINKIIQADVAILADAGAALRGLLGKVKQGDHRAWLEEFKACNQLEYEKIKRQELNPLTGGLRMAEVIDLLSKKAPEETILVSDVGQHQMAASRYYHFNTPHTHITSGGLGTMGFALPAAMGAKVARPATEVIAVIGDGGFQMTLQELGTINQSDIAVKIIILNNNFLGMVRQWQDLFFSRRYSSTEMINPDFVAIAKGYFLKAEKVSLREELEAAILRMLEHPGPYLLEVVVEKEENIFPMVPSGASVSEIRLE
jgi:acetolactate synthase-1/2/3 large subunit